MQAFSDFRFLSPYFDASAAGVAVLDPNRSSDIGESRLGSGISCINSRFLAFRMSKSVSMPASSPVLLSGTRAWW